MREISGGIKYTVPLGGCFAITLIILLFLPSAYSETEISGRLNVDTNQTNHQLIKRDRAGENRMIRENKLYDFYAIKVTTTNQKKFDRNGDGYLSGPEFKEYLAKNYR